MSTPQRLDPEKARAKINGLCDEILEGLTRLRKRMTKAEDMILSAELRQKVINLAACAINVQEEVAEFHWPDSTADLDMRDLVGIQQNP